MHNLNPPISIDELVPSLASLKGLSAFGATVVSDIRMENFLRFAVQQNVQLLLPVTAIAEVRHLSLADILPVPQTPAWVGGLYYFQGAAVWIVDLAHRLGYPLSLDADQLFQRSMLIILSVAGQHLGLAVPQVFDIEWYDPAWFDAALPEHCVPQCPDIIAGYEQHSGLLLLDPTRLVQRAILSPVPLNAGL